MSLLDFQHLHQQIKEKLFEISYIITCFNKAGDNDISRYAETYFKNILNVIYRRKGWSFEKAAKINQETYDLYDTNNKVCIQVTSNNRLRKKRETIKGFEKLAINGEFTTLIILFTSNSKPTQKIPSENFNYSDFNIIELSSQIESHCNQSELLEIRDVLFFIHSNSFKENVLIINPEREKTLENIERVFLKSKKVEKELRNELVFNEYWKQIDREELSKNPYLKFKDSRFILRSIEDDTYPNVNDNSNWSRTFMYDFYDKGILIWLDALSGTRAIVNQQNQWYIEDYRERHTPPPKGCEKIDIRILGKLPYKFIVHWQDGDEYYNDYHLFCKYIGVNKLPFEEIVYRFENGLGYYWEDLDKLKKIK